MSIDNDPLVGHTLAGRFNVLKALDDEELGRVYLAETSDGATTVQIKVLHPHLVDDHATFSRFGREMLATATIQHPNTVAMLDFGEHNNLWHYLVLEHFDGVTLAEEIERHRQIPIDRAVHIAAQVASALVAAESEAIVHRNLSPRNILLVEGTQDFVKVRDFGLARLNNPQEMESEVTAINTRVGTSTYMAPEYIMSAVADTRSDLYALGCVLHEMVAGEPPFVGDDAAVVEAHTSQPAPKLSKIRRNVPRWLEDVVQALLNKDPDTRPQHPAEVIRMLEEGAGRSLHSPPPLGSGANPTPRQSGPNAGVATAVVGTALGTAVVAVLVLVVVALVVFLLLTS